MVLVNGISQNISRFVFYTKMRAPVWVNDVFVKLQKEVNLERIITYLLIQSMIRMSNVVKKWQYDMDVKY